MTRHQHTHQASSPTVSRRRFIQRSTSLGLTAAGFATAGGTAALSAVLAGCSSEPGEPPTVVSLFSPDRVLVAGVEQRIPFAVVAPTETRDVQFALPRDDETVTVRLMAGSDVIEETEAVGRLIKHDHVGTEDEDGNVPEHQHSNLFRYYAPRFTMPEVNIYDIAIDVGGTTALFTLQAFDPAEVTVPYVGVPLPVTPTPTFEEPGVIDRLCTRPEDPCPFHDRSLDEIIKAGEPVAVLVATPAFCSTAYCGPVLDTLVEAADELNEQGKPVPAIVHVEVYENPDSVDGNYADPNIRLAPAVAALNLTFEPSLFLVDATGTIIDRIDNVFDVAEAVDALTKLSS